MLILFLECPALRINQVIEKAKAVSLVPQRHVPTPTKDCLLTSTKKESEAVGTVYRKKGTTKPLATMPPRRLRVAVHYVPRPEKRYIHIYIHVYIKMYGLVSLCIETKTARAGTNERSSCNEKRDSESCPSQRE